MAIDKKTLKENFIAFGKQIAAFLGEETPEEKNVRESKEAKDKSKIAGFKSEKFAEAKLKDGRMISYDGETPATGMLINISDDAGNYTPAPDGEYEMEDGGVLTVKEGMIVDIKAAAGGEDEDMSSIDKKINSLQIDKKIDSLKNEIASLKEEKTKMASEFKSQLDGQTKLVKELFDLVEQIADLPAEESATDKKKDSFSKKTGHGSLEEYFARIKKAKKSLIANN